MIDKEENEAATCSRLLEVELKIKAMSYLFENQGGSPFTPPPSEFDDIHAGLGRIIGGFGEEIAMIRRKVESIDIVKTKNRNKNMILK